MAAIITAVIFLCAGMSLTSCGDENGDDDMVWDFAPYEVRVRIVDGGGVDLLSPETGEGSLYGELMYMVYNGEQYMLEWPESLQTRYYMPHFYGLKLAQYESSDGPRYELLFGEFDGEVSADRSMQFLIHNINTVFDINVSNRVEWKKGKPDVTRAYWLNGQLVENGIITITL